MALLRNRPNSNISNINQQWTVAGCVYQATQDQHHRYQVRPNWIQFNSSLLVNSKSKGRKTTKCWTMPLLDRHRVVAHTVPYTKYNSPWMKWKDCELKTAIDTQKDRTTDREPKKKKKRRNTDCEWESEWGLFDLRPTLNATFKIC